MKELEVNDYKSVSGGNVGAEVIKGALGGNAPGPSALTGTASGPTPGSKGGRYRVSDRNKPRSSSNLPGGEIGRTINKVIEKATKKDD